MKYHYDISPVIGDYCPYCTNDGPLCLFDKCDIEEACKAGNDDKLKEIHDRLKEEKDGKD